MTEMANGVRDERNAIVWVYYDSLNGADIMAALAAYQKIDVPQRLPNFQQNF